MTRKITLCKKLDAASDMDKYTKNLKILMKDVADLTYTNLNTAVYHDGRVEIELEHDLDAYRAQVRLFEESVRILIGKGYKRKRLF